MRLSMIIQKFSPRKVARFIADWKPEDATTQPREISTGLGGEPNWAQNSELEIMTKGHVPISRRFGLHDNRMLHDIENRLDTEFQYNDILSWKELLKESCVVILGEGKSGKTHEFQMQVRKLRKRGEFAIFIPLELLHENEVFNAIHPHDNMLFETWLNSSVGKGFIFLDSVDELKLKDGSFRIALNKIKCVIGKNMSRLNIYVSCRPFDWNNEIDSNELEPWLAPRFKEEEVKHNDDDPYREISWRTTKKESIKPKLKIVTLQPLDRDEILDFAEKYESDCSEKLKSELEKKELWHLYHSPADIIDAVEQIKSIGQLYGLENQLNYGIINKLKESPRRKFISLSLEKANKGVEVIALAMFLLKKRSITENRELDSNISLLLSRWRAKRIAELLRKPIFVPTGIGAVRFHHRSTQEFLAAKRLKKLLKKGLSYQTLYSLLFEESGNEKVTIPSMEPLAAWLALWDDQVWEKVNEINPKLLFREGLPSSMSIEQRSELLHNYIDRYNNSDWRGGSIRYEYLKRLTSVELESVVKELWEKAYKGHQTRKLLLDLINITPLKGCADLAFSAAVDETLPENDRINATIAVLKHGTDDQKERLGEDILRFNNSRRFANAVIPYLLLGALTIENFIEFTIGQVEKAKKTDFDLKYALYETMLSNEIQKDEKIELINKFADEVWKKRTSKKYTKSNSSEYVLLTDSIVAGCYAVYESPELDICRWAWALCTARHFQDQWVSNIAKDMEDKINELLANELKYREAYFWACIKLYLELNENSLDSSTCKLAINFADMDLVASKDAEWLFRGLESQNIKEIREVAFYALSGFIEGGNNTDLANRIQSSIQDRSDLAVYLEWTVNQSMEIYQQAQIQRAVSVTERTDAVDDKRKTDKWEEWKEWRDAVLHDSHFLLDDDARINTQRNILVLLRKIDADRLNWVNWNSDYIREKFSNEFLDALLDTFSVFWRSQDVKLPTEREENEQNTFSELWIISLLALKSESENPGWTQTLDEDEAALAIRISTIEQNGFADPLYDLEKTYPSIVDKIIGEELEKQLHNLQSDKSAPYLQKIYTYGSERMKSIAANILCEHISHLPVIPTLELRRDIECFVELIATYGTSENREELLNFISSSIEMELTYANVSTFAFWIGLAAQIDPLKSCDLILNKTEGLTYKDEFAIELFAVPFSDRHPTRTPNFDRANVTSRVASLGNLVLRAYELIRPEDDLQHDGVYSPGIRDDAESARRFLFDSLVNIASPETYFIIQEFLQMPAFSALKDRLKQILVEVAAKASELKPMTVEEFMNFNKSKKYKKKNYAIAHKFEPGIERDFAELFEDIAGCKIKLKIEDPYCGTKKRNRKSLAEFVVLFGEFGVNFEALTIVWNPKKSREKIQKQKEGVLNELRLAGIEIEPCIRYRYDHNGHFHDRIVTACYLKVGSKFRQEWSISSGIDNLMLESQECRVHVHDI